MQSPAMQRRGSHPDTAARLPISTASPTLRSPQPRQRRRGGLSIPYRRYCLYLGLVFVFVAVFALAAWQQRAALDNGRIHEPLDHRDVVSVWPMQELLEMREPEGGSRLEVARSQPRHAHGLRPMRLALVMDAISEDSHSLMVLTLAKTLTDLGYSITIFISEEQDTSLLKDLCNEVFLLGLKNSSVYVDWSNFEGVVLCSLEGKRMTSSLMQEPFLSVPLVWIIHEHLLGKRLSTYIEKGLKDLINQWRNAFQRPAYIVFPDYSFPLMYSSLDNGNFLVIPGSPVDIWAIERYTALHSRFDSRKDYGYGDDDIVILITGNYLFLDDLPSNYRATLSALASHILEITHAGYFRVQLGICCGDSTNNSFQDLASNLGLPDGSVRHYSTDHDLWSLLLATDIALYNSVQEEPSFPPLLLQAMNFGVPIVAPNISAITNYVVDSVHGFLFYPNDSTTVLAAFSQAIGEHGLSKLARTVGIQGRLLSKNMLAYSCISSYGKLFESVLEYPSDVELPRSFESIEQKNWLWDLLEKRGTLENVSSGNGEHASKLENIVDLLEMQSEKDVRTSHESKNTSIDDYPTKLDWDDLNEIEILEDIERREIQELEERTVKPSDSWGDVYRTARKAEKLKFEENERDEGELERTGQPVCIYEVYNGEGAWPSLHHGSMYRGITLSKGSRRVHSDDIDAVLRLPILNDLYYNNLFCEFGGMLAIANKVDYIHKLPWIGFQSWRATGRKVSLSNIAEEALEEALIAGKNGDVVYYWVRMDSVTDLDGTNKTDLTFWSVCDHMNVGLCSVTFEQTFRQIYGLPDSVAGLPPMPGGIDSWSVLHSWVMPTSSYLEFVMFSRIFVDSLHSLTHNETDPGSCLLGSSQSEKRHCYCRMLEILVNVWAYHSGRRLVYLNPVTGEFREQYPPEDRKYIWAKYFEFSLLKNMDEDLAEEADDGTHPGSNGWLWPLTGEVYWQGIADRERLERYQRKSDKKFRTKSKLWERQRSGYKQKPLA